MNAKELASHIVSSAVRNHCHDTPLEQRLADIELTISETITDSIDRTARQLAAQWIREAVVVAELERLIREGEDEAESSCDANLPPDNIEQLNRWRAALHKLKGLQGDGTRTPSKVLPDQS